ncbi:hypothetical protein KL907_004257 [Ogataea polymorpha]|nr:hypothetical protein KL907_004257 [Ogataea polymorpha]
MLLLDGALGTELEKRGVDVSGGLWSGRAVLDSADTVRAIHLDYMRSGANIVLTATYQLCDANIEQNHQDPHAVYTQAVGLCAQARREYEGDAGVKIAGSIGPYGAYLADGSEYTGNYGSVTDAQLRSFHEGRFRFLAQSSDVDVLALETIPSFQEIRVLAELASTQEKPWYLSLSVRETALVDGTPLAHVVSWLDSHYDRNLVAVGVNCCGVRVALPVVEELDRQLSNSQNLRNARIVLYPNSGEVYDGTTKTWSGEPSHFVEAVKQCLQYKRVGIVGGCCRTGPADIRQLRTLIDESDSH